MMRNSRMDEPEELLEPLPGICYGRVLFFSLHITLLAAHARLLH